MTSFPSHSRFGFKQISGQKSLGLESRALRILHACTLPAPVESRKGARSGPRRLETVGPVSQVSGVALAPDGQHIEAAMGEVGNRDLRLLDGTRGTSSRLRSLGD